MSVLIELKKCKKCQINKPTSDFYKLKQKGDKGQVWHYFDSLCKKCKSDYNCNRRRDIKKQIIDYLGGKCLDCGIVDLPCIYDCHHLDDLTKDFSPGMKSNLSFDTMKTELDKCILLCSNCHRKRHL